MAGALGFVLLGFNWPRVTGILPPCSVRELTGLYCPGCGGTRCATNLLKGDLPGAFTMNPLLFVLGSVATGLLATAVIREWKGNAPVIPQLPAWPAWVLVGLVIAFGLVRNLPWWPFTLLVPH
jgi:hypothetical protein